jgi:hypothetical protein
MNLMILYLWELNILESADQYQSHSCLSLLKNKPQINADERRFVNLNIQHFSEVYQRNSLIKSPQNSQKTQSTVILIFAFFAVRILRHPNRSTDTNLEDISFFATQSKRSNLTT